MRFVVNVLIVLFFAWSPAIAQTPLERLPQGRLVPGWAVEAIPADQAARTSGGITDFAGRGGLSRVSVRPSLFSSMEFIRSGGISQRMALNGRAFFRVRSPQRYVFVAAAQANVTTGGTSGCEFALSVGRRWINTGRFSTARERDMRRLQRRGHDVSGGAVMTGTVDLEPGFYPIEFVVGCLNSYQPADIQVEVLVRGDGDASPRPFNEDELFHILR